MATLNDRIEAAANRAQRAGSSPYGGSGTSNFMDFMIQRMMLGNRTPAATSRQGLVRFLAPFLVGMIAQGVNEWKANYDARGDVNAEGDYLTAKVKAGEHLTPIEQKRLAELQQLKPERFRLTNEDLGIVPPVAAQQGDGINHDAIKSSAQQGDGINRDAIKSAAQRHLGGRPFPQVVGTQSKPTTVDFSPAMLGSALSAEAGANLQDALQHIGVDDQDNDWLRSLRNKGWR